MVNAQEWLDGEYPKEGRNKIIELDIEYKNLKGEFYISDFINLKELNCSGNELTSLSIIDCPQLEKINCSLNRLTSLTTTNCPKIKELQAQLNQFAELDFLNDLNHETLEELVIFSNNFSPQNLSVFSKFVNLKDLDIANTCFYGSFESLKDLKKLRSLEVWNTNINSGLEHLSKNLKWIDVTSGSNHKFKEIRKILIPYDGNIEKWRKDKQNGVNFFKEQKVANLEKIIKEKINIPGKLEKMDIFETWFNPNCAIVINKLFWYSTRLVVYEPAYREAKEILKVEKFPNKTGWYWNLGEAETKAEEIKKKLTSNFPISAILSDTEIWENDIRDLWKPNFTINFINESILAIPQKNPGDHFKPFDIIKIPIANLISHCAIYLGDNLVCHISNPTTAKNDFLKEIKNEYWQETAAYFSIERLNIYRSVLESTNTRFSNFYARIETWENFLNKYGRDATITRYHSIIPLKPSPLVREHIELLVQGKYGKDEYNLLEKNCEHFVNLCVYSLNYSEQAQRAKNIFSALPVFTNNICLKFREQRELVNTLFANLKKERELQTQVEVPSKDR